MLKTVNPKRKVTQKSKLEESLFQQLSVLSGNWRLFPQPERNVRDWCPGRKLELDFFWRVELVSCEVQGDIWEHKCSTCGGTGKAWKGGVFTHTLCRSCKGTGRSAGKHGRGKGIEADCEKICLAATLGIFVLPVTSGMIRLQRQSFVSQAALYCKEALEVRKCIRES